MRVDTQQMKAAGHINSISSHWFSSRGSYSYVQLTISDIVETCSGYDAKNCVPDKEISFHHVPYVEDENEGGGQLVFFRSLHDTMAVASNESVSKLNGFRDNLQNLWRGKARLVYTWRHLLAPVLSLARGCRSWREGSCMYGKVGNCVCTVSWQLCVSYGMDWYGVVW